MSDTADEQDDSFRNKTDKLRTLTKTPHHRQNHCRESPIASNGNATPFLRQAYLPANPLQEKNVLSNGQRYPQVGGIGICLGAEKLEARKLPVKRGESHLSGARIVRQHGLTEPTSRRDKCLGARLETLPARLRRQNAC